jgi:hypothetical protein
MKKKKDSVIWRENAHLNFVQVQSISSQNQRIWNTVKKAELIFSKYRLASRINQSNILCNPFRMKECKKQVKNSKTVPCKLFFSRKRHFVMKP